MRLAGQLAILVLVLVVVACAPRAPLAGKAHSAMGGSGACPPPATDPTTLTQVRAIGGSNLQKLNGLWIDAQGRLIVPDESTESVRVYNAATGALLRTLVNPGGTPYDDAMHAVSGPSGRVYISDQNTDRVVIYDASFNYLGQITASLNFPQGMTVDAANGDLYVLNPGSDNIRRYSETGTFLGVAASGLTFNTDFIFLNPVTDELLANNLDTNRVHRYSKATGAFLGSFGSGIFTNRPYQMAMDRNGRLYVAESSNRVRIFTSDTYQYIHTFRSSGVTSGFLFGIAYHSATNSFVLTNDNEPAGDVYVSALSAAAVEGLTWCPCADADGDTFSPDGGACGAVDCDDASAAIYPGATDVCGNGIDEDCDGTADDGCGPCTTDLDADGYFSDASCPAATRDCDDANPLVHPGATDVCGNGLDEDCAGGDAACPICTTDLDADGYFADVGCTPLDCNDADPTISPGLGEVCANTRDDNCNGQTDEAACCALPAGDPVTIASAWTAGQGTLELPYAAAVDSQGNVLVPDNGRESVMVYTSAGAPHPTRPEIGPAIQGLSGSLNNPESVAVGPTGEIAIADRSNDRIVILNSAFGYVRTVGSGVFNGLKGVAIAANGDIYASDTVDNEIRRFSSDGTSLGVVASGLSGPRHLYIDRQAGELYVSLSSSVRRYRLSPFGLRTTIGAGRFTGTPEQITLDRHKNIYVADRMAGRVRIFGPSGAYLRSFTTGSSLIDRATGLAYDQGRDRFVVANNGGINPAISRLVGFAATAVEGLSVCPCSDADSDAYWLQPYCAPGSDCDDASPTRFPGAPEACDNADDDCDGQVDEGLTRTQACGVGACQNFATQTCTAGAWGPACTPGPMAQEACANGLDDDCDGQTDEGCACSTDNDGDTFFSDAVCPAATRDCDDADATIYPGAPEACDNTDDNCDGQIDEGVTQSQTCGVGACQATVSQTCAAGAWAPACAPGTPGAEACGNGIDEDCDGSDLVCPPSCTTDADGDGYRAEAACAPNQDCDDGAATTFPGATELCGNGDDDDCDGAIDEAGCCTAAAETCDNGDNDCDGQVDEALTQSQTCGVGACQVTAAQTCTAGSWLPACTPGGPGTETCGNGVDEDCDGSDLPCPPSGGSPLFSKGGRGGGGGGGGAGLLRERTTTLEFDADLYKAQFVYLATRPLDATVTKATVSGPPRRAAYQAFNLTISRVNEIRAVTVFMRVPLDWLAEEDINRSTPRIERYNVTWTALPTNEFAAPGAPDVPCTGFLCAVGKAFFRLLLPDEYAYFSAAAPQPGIFAVTGLQNSRLPPPPTEDLSAPVLPPPEKPPVAGPATETPGVPFTDEDVRSFQNYYILTGLVAVIVAAFVLVLLLRHVHRKATGAGDVPSTSLLALTEWITRCRAAGFTDPQIRDKLSSVGWLDELLDHYLSH